MTIKPTTFVYKNKLEELHLHLQCTKDSKYFVWSTSSEWDWLAFLENGILHAEIKRFIQIRYDECGREEVIKDFCRV